MIPLCYNPADNALYRSGSADVWKGSHNGREVAAKVLRLQPTGDFKLIHRVGPQGILDLVCALTGCHLVAVLQGGYDVEGSPPSKCAAAVRRDNDQEPVRDGIWVDEGRHYRGFRESKSHGG